MHCDDDMPDDAVADKLGASGRGRPRRVVDRLRIARKSVNVNVSNTRLRLFMRTMGAGLDPALADHEGRLPVDMSIKAANKAVVRLLALPGDLDPLVLLDYPEFVRRVSACEAPRLPTSALAAVLRRARLRMDLRDASGASRAAVARDAAPLVASLRELGGRPTTM